MSSFGEELRRERELRQISLREVAESTKINLRYLEALERNDFEHLPGGVFNRGFVRAYSQFIGIDPDSTVDAYRLEEQAQATMGTAQDRNSFHRPQRAAYREDPFSGEDAAGGRRPGRTLFWILILFVVAAVVIGAALLYANRAAAGPSQREPAAVKSAAANLEGEAR